MSERAKAVALAPIVAVVAVLCLLALRPPQQSTDDQLIATGEGSPSSRPSATAPAQSPVVFVDGSVAVSDSGREVPSTASWVRYVTRAGTSPWAAQAYVPFGGETTQQLRSRYQTDVLDLLPEAVAMLAGSGDLGELEAANTVANLAAMARLSADAGVKVFLLTFHPNDDYPNGVQAVNERIQQRFRGDKNVTVFDIYTDTVSPSGGWVPRYTDDGTGPNKAGARAIARIVLAELVEQGSTPSG